MNDIGNILGKIDNLNFALFADDLTIWTSSKNLITIKSTLQQATTAIKSFFTNIGLKLNEKKCEYTIFTHNRSKQRINLTINNQEIEYTNNPKVLGIIFDPKLNFNYHFNEILTQLNSKFKLIQILSNRSNSVN